MTLGDNAYRYHAVALWLLLTFTALTTARPFNIEDLVLQNPPYMVSEYNRVTFPIYDSYCGGSWDAMWVHPPLHYVVLGVFMKFMPVQWALNLYHLLLLAFLYYSICRLKVTDELKTIMLLGVFFFTQHMFTNWQNFSFRPELAVAYTWLTGILFLEAARKQNWNTILCFAGTVFICYTAFVHYFASPCLLSLLVYGFYYWRERGINFKSTELRVVLITAAVSCLLYGSLFLVPNFFDIARWLMSGNSTAPQLHSLIDLLKYHIEMYADSPSMFAYWGLPAGLAACAVWMLSKNTRFAGIAMLPYVLCLIFLFKVKKIYYSYPESLVAEIAFLLLVYHALNFLLPHLYPGKKIITLLLNLVVIFLCIETFASTRMVNPELFVQPYPADVVRSVSQITVGDSALIGGRHGIWYVSGAYKWYNEESNLWMHLPENLPAYLKGADFFCAYKMSESESSNWSLEGAYYCNDLQLHAVTNCPTTPFCTYSAKHPTRDSTFDFTVIFDSVFRYVPSFSGKYIAASIPLYTYQDSARLTHYAEYSFTLETRLCRDSITPDKIGFAVMSVSDFQKLGMPAKQMFRAEKESYSLHQWMDLHPVKNPTVKFYKTQLEAKTAKNP